MLLYRILILLTILISKSSFAEESVVPEIQEKDKSEVAKFIDNVNSNPIKNYELEAQDIVDKAEELKANAAKKFNNDVKEIKETVEKVQKSKNYKNEEKWIVENKENLYSKQTQQLPKLTMISQKNSVKKMRLHSYCIIIALNLMKLKKLQ